MRRRYHFAALGLGSESRWNRNVDSQGSSVDGSIRLQSRLPLEKKTWLIGKPLAWNVAVVDTFADSRIVDSTTEPATAANKAAVNKIAEYGELANSHIFFPVVIETAGVWNHLVQELGRGVTEESTFLFQRLSIAHQRGNALVALC